MKQTLTQSMAWLHTWGGLLFGWLLFAIFLTGSLAVFDQEIDHWMQPEIQQTSASNAQAIEHAVAYLQRQHADASAWSISLPSERMPALRVTAGERRSGISTYLDAQTGEPLAVRESAGGTFFFRFHYSLSMPRNPGIWIVGLAAMVMLVALVSGIIIHKKFFKEFFTFRPNKGQRSWLDMHNASAVLLLPFHLMITYTGLSIFALIYMPAALDSLYNGSVEAFYNDHIEVPEVAREAHSQPANLTDLVPLLAKGEARMGPLSGVVIKHPGRSDAQVELRRVLGNRIALSKGHNMIFDGVTGEWLSGPPELRPSVLTQRVMFGLHFAQFGGYPMRWLYFVCGLLSSAMIATGLVLYTVKRRRKYASETPLGQQLYRLVESLNIAVIAGLAVACIGLFWLSRLLPLELAERAGWEIRGFFAIWLLSLLHAWLRPRLQAWREQLSLAALLCLALPLLSLVSDGQAWADSMRLWLEVSVVLIGVMLLWSVWRVRSPQAMATERRVRPVAAEVN